LEPVLDVDGWREWFVELEICLLLNVARLEPLTELLTSLEDGWDCWVVILRCLFAGSGTNLVIRLGSVFNSSLCPLQPPIVCFCPFVTVGGGIAIRALFSDAESSWSLLS
jgi:hypothetical protein